jgi:hypothetical protein
LDQGAEQPEGTGGGGWESGAVLDLVSLEAERALWGKEKEKALSRTQRMTYPL